MLIKQDALYQLIILVLYIGFICVAPGTFDYPWWQMGLILLVAMVGVVLFANAVCILRVRYWVKWYPCNINIVGAIVDTARHEAFSMNMFPPSALDGKEIYFAVYKKVADTFRSDKVVYLTPGALIGTILFEGYKDLGPKTRKMVDAKYRRLKAYEYQLKKAGKLSRSLNIG